MATQSESFWDQRIDRGTLPLAVGDVLVIGLVLTFGVAMHNGGVSYLTSDPVGWLTTLVPFFIGWLICAPLVGAYSAGAGESAKASIPLAIRSWVPADIIGLGIRASPFFEGGADPIFIVVTLVTVGFALGVWRWLVFKVR
ncbi:hypothetical protein AUR64_19035 [Haloprofundus marisrubri]|uniref:DUF3054 domain-containing protein n=1 Tax=Haloprofundus marisrubri TaxID=1514971 RepID=A0A0W1R504_9EURY|nr:DUF3054 domain-containing protein [Haloprofundus marisrubri]KTG08331.1 hypothetical protein AUR64_19035 [Haloprofundus marisrubri]